MGKTIVITEQQARELRKRACRDVIITERQAAALRESVTMTEYKFNCNIRKFLHDLLTDPVNALPSPTLRMHSLTRSKLLRMLMHGGMLISKQKIVDDADGDNPHLAVMRVRYKVPRKDFGRRLKKLFIRLFERNVPAKMVAEDGGTGCADSAGAFEAPMGLQRRALPYQEADIEESTGTGCGYEYTVPMGTKSPDDPSLKRGRGKGGSTSIEPMDEEYDD